MTDASVARRIDWERFLPLALLLRALRLAVGARALVLSTLGLWLMVAGWKLCAQLFGIPQDVPFNLAQAPWARPAVDTDVTWIATGFWLVDHGLVFAWLRISAAFRMALDPNLSIGGFCYLASCGVWVIAVWSVLGGVLTRSAAVGLAREERAHLRAVWRFVRVRWISIVAAPLCVLVGIALVSIPVVLLGWCMRFSFGMLLAGLLWPLVIGAGVVLALLALGLAFGWPLMWAAVAAEGADAFEAISRAYTYVFHRPLYYLLLIVEAALVGAVGWLLVSLFTDVLLAMCNWAASWGLGGDALKAVALDESSGLRSAGCNLIGFLTALVVSVPVAFSYSYLWNASTAIYFMLRREIEATELDDVFIPEEAETRYGLPPLDAGASGVPQPK